MHLPPQRRYEEVFVLDALFSRDGAPGTTDPDVVRFTREPCFDSAACSGHDHVPAARPSPRDFPRLPPSPSDVELALFTYAWASQQPASLAVACTAAPAVRWRGES